MTGALDQLRQSAVELLESWGVPAVLAMAPSPRKQWTGAVAAVSVAKVKCAAGGFRDFLGLEENGDEVWGKGVEITLAMDLFAPMDGGESACREAFDRLAQGVLTQGIGGLDAESLESGETEFSRKEGLYRMPVRCLCRGWLTAVADSGGAFENFEVKGRRI